MSNVIATLPAHHAAASDWRHKIKPLREQTAIRDRWLTERLATILPEVMREEGIDVWLVVAREYNEDPVLMSLLPATMLSARRRTVLVFHAPADGEFRAMAIANAGIGIDSHYRTMWNKSMTAEAEETQEECLRRVVAECSPKRIGVNVSADLAFGDGLSHHEHGWLMSALGDGLAGLCVGAEKVAVGWLERRLPVELDAASGINQMAHGVIAEAFSSRVTHPGVTTAADLAWWLRQRTQDVGLSCWFHPTVSVQRRGQNLGDIGASPDLVIRPGDLLHCDYGLHYLGLATDTQQNAYVLRPGEVEAPVGLRRALQVANRQQDLLAAQMVAGRTGDQILAATLAAMREEGIEGRVYSHPVGTHGHGAGPFIGRYDRQDGVPGVGQLPLVPNTMFSFEMFIETRIPEWDDQQVKLATEQIVAFRDETITYLGGRQTEFHLIA
ncbi:MAG: M24 family metallopeptidase [Trueperaceae bacterium]